ncbi:MAG: trehalase family glycosidase [Bryobacteraceae bacterium]
MQSNISRKDFVRCALGLPMLTGVAAVEAAPSSANDLGKYFIKKRYTPAPLPRWESTKDRLPAPAYDDRPDWVSMYWKSWELAFRNFHEPAPASGFVSQFIDAAFNADIFLWDSCFMTMFCNYAHSLVPGIGTLDNFYAKQHLDGEICREIVRNTGIDYSEWVNRENRALFSRWGKEPSTSKVPYDVLYRGRPAPRNNPKLTLDALNHPILAWAEVESYGITGDKARLDLVWEPLVRYYDALQEYLRQGNGLYMTDWASMDNSTRNTWLDGGGTGIDISSEMVLFARNLAAIAGIQGHPEKAKRFAAEAERLSGMINEKMWDPERRFYFDLTQDGKRAPVKTIAGFWPLLAKVASAAQADALADELKNPKTFNRQHRVPTLAADESGYDPAGGYWTGSVWAPTDTMVIRGLENYGHDALAREIALNHLNNAAQVYERTATIWENYAPDSTAAGKPARPDFAGMSAVGPILYLIEYAVGLRANARDNSLHWKLAAGIRHGCERFRFNGHVTSLLAEPKSNAPGSFRLKIESDGEYTLHLYSEAARKDLKVLRGHQELET